MPTVEKIKPAHTDDRGDIIDVVDGEEFVHAGICTFAAEGVERGAHYHKESDQINYILSGKVRYLSKDLSVDGSEVVEVVLEAGDKVESKPLEWHCMIALEPAKLLFFTRKAREEGGYEADVYRVPRADIEKQGKVE
jgi:oxalate decarboxylase/phosphoglucose isomerase-like protein (cupin superfamily)